MTATVSCEVGLPADFRTDDVLAFHRRDPLAVAERVEGQTLQKGVVWEGRPACLTIRFDSAQASAELAIDGAPGAAAPAALAQLLPRMLGLTQQVEVFERTYRDHPQLGPLIARHPGLRVPLSASPFEALSWAITGQQISVRAAISLRRRLIEVAGLRHSVGLACYPDAERVAGLNEADLRSAGFSQAKAQTLIRLGRLVAEDELPLNTWIATLPVDEIRERLMRVRGIGPWTIDYALLRGFGWLDGSLHGDVVVRRSLQAVLDCPDSVTEGQAKRWLAEFSPWRALIAAHLWAVGLGKLP
ncbi:DNA-3-methyladenine glycosylase family protein [Aromatoleum aromaticum]|uniref:DNA-3-methyladenine glycosylase II n=1 Tax=Aromatoleum aromaticum (strain DSM 19018 / LMG 30748 / EbN1) TaxID=76114 RepID=Q5NXL1_AROAE|nr:AlkA N-terminal domain-containing protein [Aromatoleum aromaticum]NMG54551.1 3-methyladenine DNA glycosylase 2 [Aromatoleum aromaticum]CAI10203.1 DNA-3-methyladenine glycosidase II [Aromatoleum aromaticum EbN1]